MEKALLRAIQIVLGLTLIAPLVVTTEPFPATIFPYVVGKTLLTRTLIEVAFGLWVLYGLRVGFSWSRSWLLAILVIHLVASLIASLFGVSFSRSIWSTYERMYGWVDLAHWTLFVFLAVSVFRSWTDWRTLLNVNITVSVVVSTIALLEYFGIYVFAFMSTSEWLDGTFGNPRWLGNYVEVSLMTALGLLTFSILAPKPERRTSDGGWWTANRSWWIAFWVAAIILDFVAFYVSGTRGAMVGLFGGLLVFTAGYALWVRRAWTKIFTITFGILAASLIISIGITLIPRTPTGTADGTGRPGNDVLLNRLSTSGEGSASARSRVEAATVAIKAFVGKPILGWGPENYSVAFERHGTIEVTKRPFEFFDKAHNQPLEELTTKGPLGFLSYMAIWLYLAVVVIRRISSFDEAYRTLLLFIVAALAVHFFEIFFLFDMPGTAPQLYLLTALVVFVETAHKQPLPRAASERTKEAKKNWLNSGPEFAAGVAVMALLTVTVVFVVNVRVFQGSQAFLGMTRAGVAWGLAANQLASTVDKVPQMAGMPRRAFFRLGFLNWDRLSDQNRRSFVQLAQTEGEKAIAAEPEDWRNMDAVGSIYVLAGLTVDPVHLERSRELAERAVELAPARVGAYYGLIRQHVAEGDHAGAQVILERYAETYPGISHLLNNWRAAIDEGLTAK
jgi:O-antigen ligase